MNRQWAAPTYWQDFESLCYDLFRAERKPRQAFKYGRQGQEQNGVDVAMDQGDVHWHGIQCKLKSELTGHKLTEDEFLAEYDKSCRHHPQLESFLLATTCPRDKNIQNLIMRMTDSHQLRYKVGVAFWEDICVLLEAHSDVAKLYYPQQFSSATALVHGNGGSISLSVTADNFADRLRLLYADDVFRKACGSAYRHITNMVSEIVDNALANGKGGASKVEITLNDLILTIRDDGKPFDVINEQVSLTDKMQGVRAVRKILADQSADLQYQYVEADKNFTRFNATMITIASFDPSPNMTCLASAPSFYLVSRDDAYKFVRNLAIDNSCAEFTLRFFSSPLLGSTSAVCQMLDQLIERLGSRKLIIKMSREAQAYAQELSFLTGAHPQISVEFV